MTNFSKFDVEQGGVRGWSPGDGGGGFTGWRGWRANGAAGHSAAGRAGTKRLQFVRHYVLVMFMTFNPALTEPDAAAELRSRDVAYYRGVLHELIDIDSDLVRLVHVQAKNQAEPAAPEDAPCPAPAVDVGFAYERITRSMRRSILLAEKLGEPVVAAACPAVRRSAARRGIIRGVEDTIDRFAEGAEADALHAELLDRLDGPDLDDDIGSRPVREIIDAICRDLGLDVMPGMRPWKRRTPADIAVLCARAAALGSAAAGVILPARVQPGENFDDPGGGALLLHGRAGCRGP